MPDIYDKKDKEEIIPIAENLMMMEKTPGWEWLKGKTEEEIKKQLDLLIEKDDIKVDLTRGEIKGMKFMFKLIKEMYEKNKRVQEDGEE